jgi:adenine-specific DNA-methyltransferase
MRSTRQKLLENFDDEVREKLRIRNEKSNEYLNLYEQRLMQLSRWELRDEAEFLSDESFILRRSPGGASVPLGLYELPRRSGHAHLYRLQHPLGQLVVRRARERELPSAKIEFDYQQYAGRVTLLDRLRGASGWLRAEFVTIESLDAAEDHIIVAAVGDDGQVLDEDTARRLVTLPARVIALALGAPTTQLAEIYRTRFEEIRGKVSSRNAEFFDAEAEKLEGWAEDKKISLEREIKDLDKQIREVRRSATAAGTLEEKLAHQKKIRTLEAQRGERRKALFAAQDEIEKQRDAFIAAIEAKLKQRVEGRPLFVIRWRLV